MATYEDDHNLKSDDIIKPQQRRARPDLTPFFSSLEIAPSGGGAANGGGGGSSASNPFRQLAEIWRGEGGEIMEGLIEVLTQEASDGTQRKGVPEGFLDGLDRVPKKKLNEADNCPICNMTFLSDSHPLVVRLPCHPSHVFDLECISPWLQLHSSCPLCRVDLVKKKTPPPPDDDEEDFDENYG